MLWRMATRGIASENGCRLELVRVSAFIGVRDAARIPTVRNGVKHTKLDPPQLALEHLHGLVPRYDRALRRRAEPTNLGHFPNV
jgi:hypothetical protein